MAVVSQACGTSSSSRGDDPSPTEQPVVEQLSPPAPPSLRAAQGATPEPSARPLYDERELCPGVKGFVVAKFRLSDQIAWTLCEDGRAGGLQVEKFLYRSQDGGSDWVLISQYVWGANALGPTPAPDIGTMPSAGAQSLAFVDELNGWLGGGSVGPSAYRTRDGGVTWEPVRSLPSDIPIGEITIAADGAITLRGHTATWVSDDAGEHWHDATNRPPDAVVDPCVTNSFVLERGLNAGTSFSLNDATQWRMCVSDRVRGDPSVSKFLFRTNDGGRSWSMLTSTVVGASAAPGRLPARGEPLHLLFQDESKGWLGLYSGDVALLRTNDGGVTWQPVDVSPSFGGVETISFSSPNDGLVRIFDGATPTVWVTTDGGDHWTRSP